LVPFDLVAAWCSMMNLTMKCQVNELEEDRLAKS
jgi:hypothetical protein